MSDILFGSSKKGTEKVLCKFWGKKGGEIKKSSTTHYAYTLSKDDNGETVREYVNSLQIFENEGKYGPYFKVRVTGPVPTADIFIQKKKAK